MDVHRTIMARSVYLWIATAAVIGFNTAAALAQAPQLGRPALVLTALLAIAGIGFGIWAGLAVRKSARGSSADVPKREIGVN